MFLVSALGMFVYMFHGSLACLIFDDVIECDTCGDSGFYNSEKNYKIIIKTY